MSKPVRLPSEPFRFVDRMIEVGEQGAGVGEKDIPLDHPFLDAEGRLPDALLVEALAQTIAFSLACALGASAQGGGAGLGLLAGARDVEFLDRARAPARLRLAVRRHRGFGGLTTFEAVASARDHILVRGKITVAFAPGSDPGRFAPSSAPPGGFEPAGAGIELLDAAEPGSNGPMRRGEKLFTGRECYLAGHFPGNPIVPGAILLETMNEVCRRALAAGASLSRVDRVRFKRIVLPGDRVTFEAAETPREGERACFSVRALVGADLAADATLCYANAG